MSKSQITLIWIIIGVFIFACSLIRVIAYGWFVKIYIPSLLHYFYFNLDDQKIVNMYYIQRRQADLLKWDLLAKREGKINETEKFLGK